MNHLYIPFVDLAPAFTGGISFLIAPPIRAKMLIGINKFSRPVDHLQQPLAEIDDREQLRQYLDRTHGAGLADLFVVRIAGDHDKG